MQVVPSHFSGYYQYDSGCKITRVAASLAACLVQLVSNNQNKPLMTHSLLVVVLGHILLLIDL